MSADRGEETGGVEVLGGYRGVALVQQGNRDLVKVALGTRGTSPDEACTADTRFQLASVSKQFTATAILLLSDKGVLSVDDPVHRWLDGCPVSWDGITIHHLLTHTSGIVHWHATGIDLTAPLDTAEELRVFQSLDLLSTPGERYAYSSPGYTMLALIVERAAERPYRSFLASEIFEPLGMTSTFAGNGAGEERLARGHEGGVPVKHFELDTVGMGAGDVWSTAGDMARWDGALASAGILSDESRRAMFRVHAPFTEELGNGRIFGYGYGWYIGEYGGRALHLHTGDNAGFVALNAWFPNDDLRLVLLSNDHSTDLTTTAEQVLSLGDG